MSDFNHPSNEPLELGVETIEPAPRPAADISPKVSGAVLGASLATIGVFVAQQFGLEIPVGVEGAIATLIGGIIGYLVPDNR